MSCKSIKEIKSKSSEYWSFDWTIEAYEEALLDNIKQLESSIDIVMGTPSKPRKGLSKIKWFPCSM